MQGKKKTYLNPLLFSDFATNGHACPQVEDRHELWEGAQKAAVPNSLGILTEDVARTEIGDNTCNGGEERDRDRESRYKFDKFDKR